MPDLTGKTLLNRYNVLELIGRGGMAEVYKIWDDERATELALKLLREDLAQDPVFLRRFRREAQTLASLQHPNIVRFYGLEQDDLLAFMLMDYVEGTSLRTEIFRVRGVGLSVERIQDVMTAVCSALHYAHRRGMVHCDLKPGNVMIEDGGRVLVADFGIARMTDAATATMVGAGTPAYMAPEQIKGADPSPQTDVYALGVVLFEMLTGGERPFTGEQATVTGTTGEKVRWEHLNLRPPSPKRWNANVTTALEAVVLRCLAKDPAERYAGAQDLLAALDAALQTELERAPEEVVPPDEEETLLEPVPPAPQEALRQAMPSSSLADRDPLGGNRLGGFRLPAWAWAAMAVAVVVGGFLLLGGGRATPAPEEEAVAAEWAEEAAAEEWPEADAEEAEEAPGLLNGEDVWVCYLARTGSFDYPSQNFSVMSAIHGAGFDFGVHNRVLQVEDSSYLRDNLETFIAQDCTLILSYMWDLTAEMEPYVVEFPEIFFSVFSPRVEENVFYPNLIHQAHALEEAAVLAGFLAAGATRTGQVGIVLNDTHETTTRIADAFVLGVQLYEEIVDGPIEVVGWDPVRQEGMVVLDSSPEMGYLVAEEMFARGVDVLFPYANYVFIEGVATVAQEYGALIIGRDFAWGEAYPQLAEVFLTSLVRRYDITTEEVIRRVLASEFDGGTVVGTLANGGVELQETPLWEERLDDYWLVMEGLEMVSEGIQDGSTRTRP